MKRQAESSWYFICMMMTLLLEGAICLTLWPVWPKPIPTKERGGSLSSYFKMSAALRLGFFWFNEAKSRNLLTFHLHDDDSSIRRCDLFDSLTSLAETYSNETTRRQFVISFENVSCSPFRIYLIQWSDKQKVPDFFLRWNADSILLLIFFSNYFTRFIF